MTQTQLDVLNFENRIIQNRRELNDLIYSYQNSSEPNNTIINEKLAHVQAEIDYMQKQVAILKSSISLQNIEAHSQKAPTPQNIEAQLQKAPTPQNIEAQPQKSPSPQNIEAQPQETPIKQISKVQEQAPDTIKPQPESKDFEKTFGKSWMGAIASVLIFVSIIMFATLLVPILTDALKMTAMFVVSFGITGFGLYRLKSDDKNSFYLSVSGCGIGAIYISLLMSNIYFKLVNDIGLFALILMWAVLVCVINRKNSVLFHVIGQLGIIIAVYTGAYLCVNSKDEMKFMMLVIFFVVSSLLFFVSNIRQKPNYKLVDHIFNAANLLILLFGYAVLNSLSFVAVIAVIYITGMVLVHFKSELKRTIPFGVIMAAYGLEILGFLGICLDNIAVYDIIGICFGILILYLTERKIQKPLDIGRIIVQAVFLFTIYLYVIKFPEDCNIYIVSVFSECITRSVYTCIAVGTIFVILGFYKKDLVYKYAGLSCVCIMLWGNGYYSVLEGITCLLFFAVLFYLAIRFKEQYSHVFKLVSYIGLLWAILQFWSPLYYKADLGNLVIGTIIFTAISFLNIIAIKTIGTINFITLETEKSSRIILNIINSIQMLLSMPLIRLCTDDTCRLVMIITALALFSVNSINLLRKYQNMLSGIYVGAKYTWLIIVILSSFNAPNIIISISCLVIAILSILVGFKMLFKSLRIYGLALSIFSVIKLILLDIDYENLVGRAAGFFVCGVLCFGVSLVYNTIDKKMAEIEKNIDGD